MREFDELTRLKKIIAYSTAISFVVLFTCLIWAIVSPTIIIAKISAIAFVIFFACFILITSIQE